MTLRDGEVDVWSVDLTGAAALEGLAGSWLSDDERARADRFRFATLRTDFVLSRGLLRAIVGRACGCPPADVRFVYGPQGKPALAGSPGIGFNLSHSGGVAVCALTAGREVGVDVERGRPMPDLEAIARRFFSPREHEDLMRLPPERREAGFFDCWVCKEAYIKALGLGLSLPLDSFSVSRSPEGRAALVEVRDAPAEPAEWTLIAFSPIVGYHAALAVRARHATVRLRAAACADVLGGARP